MLEKPIDNPLLAEALEALRVRFPGSVLDASYDRGELRVGIRVDDLIDVLSYLKSGQRFEALIDIVALDRLHQAEPGGARFRLIHQVCRFPEHVRIHLVTDVGETEAAPSAVPVYLAADWAEREIFDMYGIRFTGHPDLRRIYLPDEFDGFPLRKDFPLGGRGNGV